MALMIVNVDVEVKVTDCFVWDNETWRGIFDFFTLILTGSVFLCILVALALSVHLFIFLVCELWSNLFFTTYYSLLIDLHAIILALC